MQPFQIRSRLVAAATGTDHQAPVTLTTLSLIVILGFIQISQAAHNQRLHHKRHSAQPSTLPDQNVYNTLQSSLIAAAGAAAAPQDTLTSRKLLPESKPTFTPSSSALSSSSSSQAPPLAPNEQQIVQMLPTDNGQRQYQNQHPNQHQHQHRHQQTSPSSGNNSDNNNNSSALAPLIATTSQKSPARPVECSSGMLTFELSTGFIYKPTSAAETLSMMPSTLQLTDCLDYCLQNSSCLAINFEVGLCVLLATSAQFNQHNLYSSQFPVFTIYAEKKCLLSGEQASETKTKGRRRCQRAWTFERVAGFEMKLRPKRRLKLATKELCMDACLSEHEFECRSANWYRQTGECTLSDQDRHSVSQSEAGDQQIKASLGNFYGPAAAAAGATTTTSGATSATSANTSPPGQLYQNYRTMAVVPLQLPEASRHSNKAPALASTNQHERLSSASSSLAPAMSLSAGKKLFKQLYGKQNKFAERNTRQLIQQADGATSSFAMSQHQYVDLPASSQVVDYLENNCIYEPNKLCEFRKIQNRVLKTVDSIYQDVNSLDECKQKCLSAPYRCYSFDYGDTSERVCRTSHLDQASLLSVSEPYLEVVGAITYELATCFNVSIQCRAHEMVAKVSSSKRFQGKMYAKSRPLSCVNDVTNGLEFELAMKYHDDACDVSASSSASQGVFSNEIVIQHHDRIVTTQDMGLSVYCQYDLGNRSVTNNIDLAIEPIPDGPIESKQQSGSSANSASSNSSSGSSTNNNSPLTITGLATTVVRSPNVTMRITNMNGQPITSATVGDRLALLFEVKEKTSPFGIFVREIVAMDGRQYLQQQHQLHHHRHNHANNSTSSGGQQHRHNSQSNDNDSSTSSPSILYYTSTSAAPVDNNAGANITTTTTSTPHSTINETLIESMFQINSVNSIQFIDSDGCPTDANLMGPLVKMDPHGHRLLAPFDAFKFPTSDMVFFRAVVTSCLAECKPAVCPNLYTTTPAATSHSLYYSTLSNANSNSIIPDESLPPVYSSEPPHPGIAQLSTFNGDN